MAFAFLSGSVSLSLQRRKWFTQSNWQELAWSQERGGTARFSDEDGEEHPKQAHQQADDGEAASKHWVVSPSTRERMPQRL
jgi:hypothetical protein